MQFSPLHPPTETRPLSTSTQGWIHPTHALLGTQGRIRIRAHFTISDWLLMGGLLQCLVIILLPIRPFYALLPTFGLAVFKVTRLVLKIYGVVENPLMQGVKHGRMSAVFPPDEIGVEEKGGNMMVRSVGESIGGEEMCIFLLSNRCNHPLGLFYSKYREMGVHAKAMYLELETSPLSHGFLGSTDYSSHSTHPPGTTQPHSLSIMYFKSLTHVHNWAHNSPAHRAAWEWWDEEQKAGRVDCLSIAHEVYAVRKGGWENIYVNAKPEGFAATSHAVKDAGGRRVWCCPAMDVDGKKGFGNSAQRLGVVQG